MSKTRSGPMIPPENKKMETQVPAPKGLDSIVKMAEEALKLEDRIQRGEALLKSLKEQHRAIVEGDLPEAMDIYDLSEFKLSNGRKITVGDSYHPNISETHRDEAFEWLRENGHAGIIKRSISVEFGTGEYSIAQHLLRNLRRYKRLSQNSIKDRENVHPQTLKAWVKEQIETGEDLPMETFGVHIRRVATIK